MVIQGHEMNERIKKLAEQAGFKVNWQHEDIQAIKIARFEKFAELIVLECAQVADIERDTSAGCGYVTHTDGQRIKKHFGVDV
jgi:hypothetical protein